MRGTDVIGDILVRAWQTGHSEGSNAEDISEPFPYRSWKWLLQHKPEFFDREDLFDRLDRVDWDVLILLDACRYDVLSDIAETAVVESVRSPASATPEFLSKASQRGVFNGSVYVSANPQVESVELGSDVQHVHVYSDHWDEHLSTVRPDPVYEQVFEAAGQGRPVVAHTLQPHYPHICEIGERTVPVPNGVHPAAHGSTAVEGAGFQAMLASGRIPLGKARRSYEASTRFAWRKASSVAARLAADGNRVVVSSDHGVLFGEYGLVEHPVNVRLPKVEEVPWVVFEPDGLTDRTDGVTEQLEALGYA
jgi:hypothetical protein